MKTIIKEITRKKNYYEVRTEYAVYEIDGEFVRQYHLQPSTYFEEESLRELHQKSRFRRAYRRACYLLDERDYSYCIMYQKLMHTYQDRELCDHVMDQLVQCGAINDRRYAERYAEFLIATRKYGIHRARLEMLRKGLDKHLIEEALSAYEETAETQVFEVLAKKYGSILIDPQDMKTRNKALSGMLRLGYDYASVRNAIENYFAEQEDD